MPLIVEDTGLGDIGLLQPTSNYPPVSSLIWLLLLPILAWVIFRMIGAAIGTPVIACTAPTTSGSACKRPIQKSLSSGW